MPKIKIFEYVWTLNDGGAETLIKDYALMLDKNKFEVIVVVNVINSQTANLKILEKNGIKIISLFPKWNFLSKLEYVLLGDKIITYKLKKIVRRERPDCIHAHLGVLRYLNSIQSCLGKTKLLYTCHAEPKIMFEGSDNIKEFSAAMHLVKEHGLQLIALHNNMKKQLDEMFGVSNTIVLRNGINIERFKEEFNQKEYRGKIGIPEKAYVIGNVGRFSKVKNHEFIIDIFQRISVFRKNTFLLLVGDGPLKEDIKKYISKLELNDKCLLLSNRIDTPQLLKCMDCFLFPSIHEGLGIAFLEAQISDVYSVVSDSIPEEAFISSKYRKLSLECSIDEWVDAILNPDSDGEIKVDETEYDLKNEIYKLERIYER